MRRFLLALAGLGLLAGLSGIQARPGDVEADPKRDYTVTPEAGPWMVMVASFTELPTAGSSATHPAELAHDLALHIRRECRVPAWVFVYGAAERAEQERRIAQIREMCQTNGAPPRIRHYRVQEQYAVLVGGYKDMDAARKDLDRIKKLPTPPERFCNLVQVAGPAPDQAKGMVKRAVENPFERSFVVRNPTAPKEEKPVNDGQWDPFIKELNADEPLSLLKCRKRYTLVIKDFPGPATLLGHGMQKTTFMDRLMGRKSADTLNANALQAQAFAKALRSMKEMPLDAYVLHTRYASFVAIGGFDNLDDPKMTEARMQLSKLSKFNVPGPDGVMQIWAQPLPMEIPHF